MFAPAIADYIDRVRKGADLSLLHPVDLVLIPMANMGTPHTEAFNTLLASALARCSAVRGSSGSVCWMCSS